MAVPQSEDCRRVKHRQGHGEACFAQCSAACMSPSPQPACGGSPLNAPKSLPEAGRLFSAANGVCLILHVFLQFADLSDFECLPQYLDFSLFTEERGVSDH